MRHSLILGTALCLITGAAYAGGSHDQKPAPTPMPSPSYALAGASALAHSTSTAASSSAATAHGGNASATGGNASARGGHGGNASNGGQSQTTAYSGGNYSARGNNVDAFAPNVSTANECGLPKSAGVSFLGIGISGGFANESDDCKQRQMMMFLASTGDKAMAREMACQSNDLARRAAYSSGRPCARDARGWDRR